MYDITASIVIYNVKKEDIKKVFASFFNTKLKVKLWISDNSPTDIFLKELSFLLRECEQQYQIKDLNEKVEYIFNSHNGGYGWGHNRILNKITPHTSKYHLVLNPDIYFNEGVLEKIFEYMEKHKDVGQVMPLVKYPNGEIQYLCKMLPTPFDLIVRRFIPFSKLKEKLNFKYEMRWFDYNKIIEIPIASGCFMFFRTCTLMEVRGFDERYFMYLEDYDLSRRISEISKLIFYPEVEIVHSHEKASYKNFRMTMFHISSAIKYFNRWGWFFDEKRRKINNLIKNTFA